MRGKQDRSRERGLRRNQTEAECALWQRLRDRRLSNFKFRRQHRIGPYFADFVCADRGLVIELDGGQHADRMDYDESRTRFLEVRGYRVLRFWNNDLSLRMNEVPDEILRVTHPSPGCCAAREAGRGKSG